MPEESESTRGAAAGEVPVAWEAIMDLAEETLLKWDSLSSDYAGHSLIWEDDPEEVISYLEAIDNVQRQIDALSLEPNDQRNNASLDRAQNVLQLAMCRLEDEFRNLLEKHSESVDPAWLFDPVSGPSFGSNPDDATSQSSDGDEERERYEEVASSRPIGDMNFTIDMLPPNIVLDLSNIAKRMVGSGYITECCQVYVSIRKAILEESLYRLGLEKLSIEEVQKMAWDTLEGEISKSIQGMKVAVGVLFPSEKHLTDQVFMGLPQVSESCFVEVARGAMMQLLNFAQAIAISRRSSERLFRILDMYETLRDLVPDIDTIFSGAACASVRLEASGILTRLGEAARGTFTEFENAVQRDVSRNPVPGGAVHPLTRYVMNYTRFLSDYTNTLNQLLGDRSEVPRSQDEETVAPKDESPLSNQTKSLMSLLEKNLEEKSKLYKDPALSVLFLMNNIHYIVQKVKVSEVRTLLGDDWVKRHLGKVRQHHNGYQRAAWTKVLSCLKDEGIHVSGGLSSGVSKTVLKERFKSFNAAFEDIVKTQSSWIVSDTQLCTELRISIAEMLLPAYRSFLGRFKSHIDVDKHSERYLKYTPEDLESQLNDLFEGSSGSMNRRKSFSTTG